ncbi:MAG: hypothetical protein KC503_03985 [Myxococcales bacterium]|nr:hypothetical protein [Myxococcales bacterium]
MAQKHRLRAQRFGSGGLIRPALGAARCIIVALALLFGGCSGDDGGESQTAGPEYERTQAAIESGVRAFRAQASSGSLAGAFEAAAAAMRAADGVVGVSYSQDDDGAHHFVAELEGGILFTMPVRQVAERPDLSAAASPIGARAFASLGKSALPAGKKALFIDLHGFKTNCAQLRTLSEKVGYSAQHIKTAGVDQFKNLDAYSLLYISSHGDYITHKGVDYTAVLTSDMRNPKDDVKYIKSGEFADIQIILSRGVYDVVHENPFVPDNSAYAVTDKFFEKNSNAFAADSLVYVDTCHSTHAASMFMPPPLFRALYGKGVKTYLGWHTSVHNDAATNAANYIFTHLLGEIPSGMIGVAAKKPPIRPYGLTAVLTALEQVKGWNVDKIGCCKAELRIMDMNLGTLDTLLVPNVDSLYVLVDPTDKTQLMDVHGDFGHKPGELLLCESFADRKPTRCSTLNVTEWSDEKVTANLGSDCSKCSGYVVARVDGRVSNGYPLTEWAIDFVLSSAAPATDVGPDVKLEPTVKFRGDIVDERSTPEIKPQKELGEMRVGIGLDSSAKYTFSGTFVGSDGCTYTYEKDKNTGTVKVSAGGTDNFSGTVEILPRDQLAHFKIAFGKKAVATVSGPQGCPPVKEVQVSVSVLFDASVSQYGSFGPIDTTAPGFTIKGTPKAPTCPPDANTPR